MADFEKQGDAQEVISTPDNSNEAVAEDPEVLKKKESEKTLQTINRAAESALKAVEGNPALTAKINKLVSDAENKVEGGGFGEADINNPKILDMIAEIEYNQVEDVESKEQMINNWKKMIQGQYKDALEEAGEKHPLPSTIYGNAGWDRFQVGQDGKVRLVNENSLKARAEAMKKAKELGMEILGSQEVLG